MVQAVTGKIEASVLNKNFSELDSKVENVSGGPGDTLTSKAELDIKYPKGADFPVVVLESDGKTGYMYTWNPDTKSWKKGALYQERGISDGEIMPAKLGFNPYAEVRYNRLNFPEKYLGYDINGCLTIRENIPSTINPNHTNKLVANENVEPINFTRIDFKPISNDSSSRVFFSYYENDLIVANYEGIDTNIISFHRITNGTVVNQIFPPVSATMTNTEFMNGFSVTIGVTGNYFNVYLNGKLRRTQKSLSYFNGAVNQCGSTLRGTTQLNSNIKKISYNIEKKPYMHISVDDVNWILKELKINMNSYNSIFESPTFGFLKEMHDKYNAVFSLYLFNKGLDGWELNEMTTKFKQEFIKHASWLKFGFHAKEDSSDYNVQSKEDLLADYKQIINEIVRFANTMNVDTIPRFHVFGANRDSQFYLQENKVLFEGMLTADDNRALNGGLSNDALELVRNVDYFYDESTDLYYVRSEKRMENIVTDKFVQQLNDMRDDVNNNQIYAYFLHETFLKTDSGKKLVEIACKWSFDRHIRFDFPMNNRPML